MGTEAHALNIWRLIASEPPPAGPAPEALVAALAARGHTLSCLAPSPSLAGRLAADKPDLIHVRDATALAPLARLLSRRRLPPLVVDFRPADDLARPLARLLRSNAVDRILVPDEATKIRLVRDGRIDPNKINIVPTPDAARLEALYREVAEYKALRRREIVPRSVELEGKKEV